MSLCKELTNRNRWIIFPIWIKYPIDVSQKLTKQKWKIGKLVDNFIFVMLFFKGCIKTAMNLFRNVACRSYKES